MPADRMDAAQSDWGSGRVAWGCLGVESVKGREWLGQRVCPGAEGPQRMGAGPLGLH